MKTLILGEHDVARLLPMDECVEVMAEALEALERGEMHQPLRFVVRPPDAAGLLGLMPAHRSGASAAFGLKAVCVMPGNPARGLDAHQGVVILSDGETGEVRAVVNASAITAIRTAAVSAVATRLLARDDARELAVLGAGVQARSHLAAMAVARDFEVARIWSRTPEHAQAAGRRGRRTPFPIEVSASAEEAVAGRGRRSARPPRLPSRSCAVSGSARARTSTRSAPASRPRASWTRPRWPQPPCSSTAVSRL